ncbi:hypothetical protein J6590_014446 [Homalodisca vitripennis]|nr:hypothetical protein J6590_014446 [Homalodisca vitripennis]
MLEVGCRRCPKIYCIWKSSTDSSSGDYHILNYLLSITVVRLVLFYSSRHGGQFSDIAGKPWNRMCLRPPMMERQQEATVPLLDPETMFQPILAKQEPPPLSGVHTMDNIRPYPDES